ncbi:Junctophilin-1 [Schistosoma japonicum]|uniref:Junctophilin-1 n=1 Tax=Schistosoma japonicum TaxID=6182 RepID=A0A4Z2CXS7_SCHJA|nr:Junctophilin-1 [Schistosoma japonicum]TNN09047.1 Junctophilin-1 [Schistosoma japonicum]
MATTELEGGRFDFDDGGSYVGEWCEGRAHGLGIATGPENQGEYSGEWNMGFESRGVYIWPSGNIYSGTWLKGKRHGEGVQIKGRWVYRGSFTTGFCGRYGIKESLTSCAKYEGSWHLNQFDGFGVETNSDGSVYAGAWSKGMRQGLGVRRSAPYALAAEFSRTVRASQSQNSLPSGTDSERGWRGTNSSGGGSGGDVRNSVERGRPDERRSGFVLRSTSCPLPSPLSNNSRSSSSGYRSATPTTGKKSIFKRSIFKKLRKQKSTGDLSMVGGRAVGTFSTGGGSGGLFHGRGRRPGGSLRSNISTSSQITTNSFGRNDVKAVGNGGQGLHEFMEETLGPNVTETYSGQWNEDRRSGYGVAERSDGLRYAGEWFNNKKDGYGVTYRTDGTKEEGRYKENILIQALNRKSKLFMLRHTKLRDAIEEAVKNAEDAAKKAQESSYESAYQRAQTARTVAGTADLRAREARKLSEEARAIAREFSPEFVQLGLMWEKQNSLLKKDIFGYSSNHEEDIAGRGRRNDPNSLHTQGLIKENTIAPDSSGQIGNSLEVSGGSRQGSFRSSFRRRGNTIQQNEHYPNDHYRYHEENQTSNPNIDTKRFYSKELHAAGKENNLDVDYRKQIDQQSTTLGYHRSPAGRPIARAATTGFTGLGYSPMEQQQFSQHMAQHPHSPYLMASTSQQLDIPIEPQNNSNREFEYGTMPRTHNRHTDTASLHSPVINSAKLMKTPAQRSTEIRIGTTQLVQPLETHRAHISYVNNSQTHNYQQLEVNINGQFNNDEAIGDNWEQESVLSKEPVSPSGTILTAVSKVRRRTLPSIMTEPPIQTTRNACNKAGLQLPNTRINSTTKGSTHNSNLGCIIDDQTVHSAENLPADAADTYIIENGIRKRVQAETHHRQQNQRNRITTGPTGSPIKASENNYSEGSRPEWTTAYDPYRPAMENTGVVTANRYGINNQHSDPETSDLSPLPKSYLIESIIHLPGDVKEASMPDISMTHGHASGQCDSSSKRRTGQYPVSGELTREEIARLSQARRQEIYHEMERRKRGEIVIRLADIKDWIRANFVIVFVLLINASLAFFFFNLLTDNSNQAKPYREATINTGRSQPSGSNSPAMKTIKTAKKYVTAAIKARQQNGAAGQ